MKNLRKIMAVLLALLMGRVSFVLNDKFSYKYDSEYYQDPGEYDVLFLGSSHIMNSIYPLEMFRSQGITAYNLGMTNESLAACDICIGLNPSVADDFPLTVFDFLFDFLKNIGVILLHKVIENSLALCEFKVGVIIHQSKVI